MLELIADFQANLVRRMPIEYRIEQLAPQDLLVLEIRAVQRHAPFLVGAAQRNPAVGLFVARNDQGIQSVGELFRHPRPVQVKIQAPTVR